MWGRKLQFLLLIFFLLSDSLVHPQAPPHTRSKNDESPSSVPLLETKSVQDEDSHIRDLVSGLEESLRGLVHPHGNLSCAELDAGPWKGAGFSRELLGLVMVPVMASAGCLTEAEELVRNLFSMLGREDTRELLEDVVALMRSSSLHRSRSVSKSKRQVQAVMFNIQQLAEDEDTSEEKRCQGWKRMKDTVLLGQKVNRGKMRLNEAKNVCRNLGFVCAGVTRGDPTVSGSYHAIFRSGSWIATSPPSNGSESWIQSCMAWRGRWRRNVPHDPGCRNEKEERVYSVVDWIPGVSTLYNLGTAVYYAAKSCSETAKERALMIAVDLGTDALMVATGGGAGLAGYALGAGLKTSAKAGVKYLLNRMNQEEDLLRNQNRWDYGTIRFQY